MAINIAFFSTSANVSSNHLYYKSKTGLMESMEGFLLKIIQGNTK